MPATGTLLILLNIVFIIHAARPGRFWPWGLVMFFLPGLGRIDEATGEFSSLAHSVPGPEPRIRMMHLLDRTGRKQKARAIAEDVIAGLKRAPAFARAQRERYTLW